MISAPLHALRSRILKRSRQAPLKQIYAQFDGWHLSMRLVTVAGIETAIYVDNANHTETTLLFVHGVGGDHHGMMPLAYCLKDTYRVIFVDLPGHGNSAMPPTTDITFLKRWSQELLAAFDMPIEMVVGHSFGCYSAQFMAASHVCYINPPLSLSPGVLKYSLTFYSIRHLASLVYNIRPYAHWRGKQLVHTLDPMVEARIAWVSDSTSISRAQFLFHARQGRQITDGRKLMLRQHVERPGSSVILSEFDKIATLTHEHAAWIEKLPVLTLPNDHLSILESPEIIARTIDQQLSAH